MALSGADLPVFEVKGGARQQGYAFEPRLVYEERALASGWGFGANVSAVISDARLGRYFYEVAPEFANGGRPAYQAKAGLIVTRLGVSMSYKVSPDLSLFAFVRAESYAGSANRDSPLYQRRASTAAGLAFAWTLARSQARAAN